MIGFSLESFFVGSSKKTIIYYLLVREINTMKLLDWSSLQTRITLGMLLAILLTVWLATLLASRVLRDEMEASILAQQYSAVTLAAKVVDLSISERIDAIEELADYLARNGASVDKQRSLEDLLVLPRMFNWGLMVLDAKIVAQASIPVSLNRTGTDYHEVPVFREAMEQKRTMVTDPLIGKITGQPLVSIIAPIRDSAGQVLGLVVGAINLAKPNFFDTVNSANYGVTGSFFVTAPKSRRYVASSDKRRVMQVGPPVGVNLVYDRQMAGNEGSGLAVSSRGVLELSSASRIPSANWIMSSVLPADEAFAPVVNMQRSLFGWALLLTLLVGGVTCLWLRRQFRPVSEASKLLIRMGDGSLSRQPLPVHRDDEIGQLASAFNGLLTRIVAEEKLAVEYAANERVRKIVSHVPGVVFQYRIFEDGRGCFPFASEAFVDIFGVLPENVRENTDAIRDMVHPEDKDRFFASLYASADSLALWRTEYRICRPDGVTKWLRVEAMPELDHGQVTWYGFIADITDAKEMAENLRIAATTFLTEEGIVITDANNVILRVNPSFTKITGYTSDDVVGLTPDAFFSDYHKESFYQTLREELLAKGVWQGEIIKQRKNGEQYPAWLIITAVKDEQGATSHYVGMFQDITARKKAEEEKAKLQTQLYQAQKMEAIGTLAGGIAHDFNNILSVILGYSEMAKEDAPLGTKYQEDLAKVYTAANRAKDLVKQILAFSRQAQVERIPLKIQPLIREGMKIIRALIPSTISITQEVDPESGTILADPTQMYQILINLCTNAQHAMEATGGVLAVSCKTTFIDKDDKKMLLHVKPGEYVELMVTDTGSGIDPHIIGKIFDPYFTTKDSGKGTGMGLAIIHGIMKECGGTITVESRKGKGSVFHVFFPVVNEAVECERVRPENFQQGKERILFIDDEELLAEMGQDMLERLGYHVTVRHNSIEALTTFQNTPHEFDLVITDQTMPDMTGVDLARRMLQIRPDIPIILCTGYSNLIDENSAKAIGIREFTLKPVTKELLAQLIRNVLDKK